MQVTLRPFNNDDKASLIALANNKNIINNLFDTFPFPYTSEAANAFLKDQNSGDSAGSSVIPVAVQIDPSGLMKPAVTFKNDLKLSCGHTMYTCYSLTEGNSIVTMIRHLNTMKIATIKVN